MNKLLLIPIFFAANYCFAQNYKTVYAGRTTHFSSIDLSAPGKVFYNTISIDSSAILFNGEDLFNFMNFEDSIGRYCYPANRTTWMAQKYSREAAAKSTSLMQRAILYICIPPHR